LSRKAESLRTRKYVEFSKEPEGLVIVLLPEEDIEEEVRAIAAKEINADSQLAEVIEWQLCNGWELLRPEEVGALTDAPILSDNVERDNQGNVTHVGIVY
jgi:hypothetical protein